MFKGIRSNSNFPDKKRGVEYLMNYFNLPESYIYSCFSGRHVHGSGYKNVTYVN